MKTPNRKRSVGVFVYLTKEEARELKRRAKSSGASVTAFIANVLFPTSTHSAAFSELRIKRDSVIVVSVDGEISAAKEESVKMVFPKNKVLFLSPGARLHVVSSPPGSLLHK